MAFLRSNRLSSYEHQLTESSLDYSNPEQTHDLFLGITSAVGAALIFRKPLMRGAKSILRSALPYTRAAGDAILRNMPGMFSKPQAVIEGFKHTLSDPTLRPIYKSIPHMDKLGKAAQGHWAAFKGHYQQSLNRGTRQWWGAAGGTAVERNVASLLETKRVLGWKDDIATAAFNKLNQSTPTGGSWWTSYNRATVGDLLKSRGVSKEFAFSGINDGGAIGKVPGALESLFRRETEFTGMGKALMGARIDPLVMNVPGVGGQPNIVDLRFLRTLRNLPGQLLEIPEILGFSPGSLFFTAERRMARNSPGVFPVGETMTEKGAISGAAYIGGRLYNESANGLTQVSSAKYSPLLGDYFRGASPRMAKILEINQFGRQLGMNPLEETRTGLRKGLDISNEMSPFSPAVNARMWIAGTPIGGAIARSKRLSKLPLLRDVAKMHRQLETTVISDPKRATDMAEFLARATGPSRIHSVMGGAASRPYAGLSKRTRELMEMQPLARAEAMEVAGNLQKTKNFIQTDEINEIVKLAASGEYITPGNMRVLRTQHQISQLINTAGDKGRAGFAKIRNKIRMLGGGGMPFPGFLDLGGIKAPMEPARIKKFIKEAMKNARMGGGDKAVAESMASGHMAHAMSVQMGKGQIGYAQEVSALAMTDVAEYVALGAEKRLTQRLSELATARKGGSIFGLNLGIPSEIMPAIFDNPPAHRWKAIQSARSIGEKGFLKQFVAGSGRIEKAIGAGPENVTTASFWPSYLTMRLNDLQEMFGLGFSPERMGGPLTTTAKFFGQRIAPAMGAVSVANYVDYRFREDQAWEGTPLEHGIFHPVGKAVAGANVLRAKLFDVTGATSVLRRVGQIFPDNEPINWGIPIPGVSLAIGLPFANWGKSAEELKEWYESGTETVRKGRFWPFGKTPWGGGRDLYTRPNWLRRTKAGAFFGGSPLPQDEYYGHHPVYGALEGRPLDWLTDKYWEEREMEKQGRPMTFSGPDPYFQKIPLFGEALGYLVKPPKYMARGEDYAKAATPPVSGEIYLPSQAADAYLGMLKERNPNINLDKWTGIPGMLHGMDSPSGKSAVPVFVSEPMLPPRSPVHPKLVAANIKYKVTELAGLYGYMANNATGGDWYDEAPEMMNTGLLTDPERNLYEAQYGGMFEELPRRLIPHRIRSRPIFDATETTLPSWLPHGIEHFRDFSKPSVYMDIPQSEMRLPGEIYEKMHTLHGSGSGEGRYSDFDRFKVLADVSPWSDEYTKYKAKAKVEVTENPELQTEYDKIVRDRDLVVGARHRFQDYQFMPGKSLEPGTGEGAGMIGDINYGIKEEAANNLTLPEKALGAAGEAFGHIRSPWHEKFGGSQSAYEQWENYQVYGTRASGWDKPVENFLEPWSRSLWRRNPMSGATRGAISWQILSGGKQGAAVLGAMYGGFGAAARSMREMTTGKKWIPDKVIKKWTIDEYFDILEYTKWSAIRKQAEESGDSRMYKVADYKVSRTMYGADIWDQWESKLSWPKDQRDYYESFKRAPPAQRDAIMQMVPRLQGRMLLAAWNPKLAIRGKEMEEAGKKSVLKATLAKWGGKGSDVLSNIYRSRPDLQEYFQNHTLPGPDWPGWQHGSRIEWWKLKTIVNEAYDIHEFGFWEEDMRQVATMPFVKPIRIARSPGAAQTTDMSAFLEGSMADVNVDSTSYERNFRRSKFLINTVSEEDNRLYTGRS